MANYHLSAKAISRSAGRSATAAAAYRAGCKIADTRTGEIHDYTKKQGVLFSAMILPEGGKAGRAEFWNKIELHHKRGDAVLAREIEVSLPTELTLEQRQELAVSYATELANRYGVAADVCLHAPRKLSESQAEKSYHEIEEDGSKHNGNWHAHIMLSACYVSPDGTLGKKAVELDPIHCKRAKIENAVEVQRVRWQDLANAALESAGHDVRIDHRTLEAQGIKREAQIHHKNRPSLIAVNDEIKAKNTLIVDLSNSLTSVETELALLLKNEAHAIRVEVAPTPEPTAAPLITYHDAFDEYKKAEKVLENFKRSKPAKPAYYQYKVHALAKQLHESDIDDAKSALKAAILSKRRSDSEAESFLENLPLVQKFAIAIGFGGFGETLRRAKEIDIETEQVEAELKACLKALEAVKNKTSTDYMPQAQKMLDSEAQAHTAYTNALETEQALEQAIEKAHEAWQEALDRDIPDDLEQDYAHRFH